MAFCASCGAPSLTAPCAVHPSQTIRVWCACGRSKQEKKHILQQDAQHFLVDAGGGADHQRGGAFIAAHVHVAPEIFHQELDHLCVELLLHVRRMGKRRRTGAERAHEERGEGMRRNKEEKKGGRDGRKEQRKPEKEGKRESEV